MTRVVIAPDSFKGSLSASDAADAIAAGFRAVLPAWEYVKLPLADGGEGTVAAMVASLGGNIVRQQVTGPLGLPVDGFYGLSGDGETAIIEIAAAAGLTLMAEDTRNPWLSTSFGVGELIRAALDKGARHFIIGLGGSGSNDGGAGMAAALGVRFLDDAGQPIGHGGGALSALAGIDASGLDPRLGDCRFDVACDVDNPLTGADGASVVYGPQKGATPAMVAKLDANLAHYARCIASQLGVAVASQPGAGAAGGLGAGLIAFLRARLQSGFDLVAGACQLEEQIARAHLVLTGEGRIDAQSLRGKVPAGVACLARKHGKPVIALAGAVPSEAKALRDHGIDAMFSSIGRPGTLAEILAGASADLRQTACNIATVLRIGGRLSDGRQP